MILYTGGTFDIMHYGHIAFLKKCRKLADPSGSVIVSLNTDEFIARYKGKPPILSYKERELTLLEIGLVDKVVPNVGDEDSKPAIEGVKPDIIAIGSDWAKKDYYKQMMFTQDWLDERGILLCYIPYTKEISTTRIKQRVEKNKADRKN